MCPSLLLRSLSFPITRQIVTDTVAAAGAVRSTPPPPAAFLKFHMWNTVNDGGHGWIGGVKFNWSARNRLNLFCLDLDGGCMLFEFMPLLVRIEMHGVCGIYDVADHS